MIRIVADTLSCISTQTAKEKGIFFLPQIIIFGDETYRDDTEMSPLQFLQKQATSPEFPKTAAPQPILYAPIFKEIAEKNDTAIVICPSGSLSGTLRSAQVGAQDFPDADIRIVDTNIIAAGLGTVVLQALEWARQGLDADTIIQKIKELSARNKVYFVVDTLEYLHRGGRIGAASALMGSLLDMKPILSFIDGKTEAVEKQRTKKRALSRMIEIIMSNCPHDSSAHVTIMHGNVEKEAQELAEVLKSKLGIEDIELLYPPPAVLVHAGPGVLGVSYFIK
ncbi:MAG TPA: DegV family protein [Longilinea sp.]|nr:DegV family protein [Longilinea sp.]